MRKRFASYFDQLRFDPKLANSFLAKYLGNPRLVLLVIIMVTLTGYTSLISIPRVLNPEIKIPLVIISTALPGAGPQDTESLVTIPIENAVTGVQNVKTVTSSSQDSASVVQVQFNDGIDPEKARTDIQSAVDAVITTLPANTQTPKVEKLDFQNQPIWSFVLTGENNDVPSLERFSRQLRDRLKSVSSIKDVRISGLEGNEIQVLVRPEAVTTYHVSPMQLAQAISTAVKSFPAGSIRTDTSTFSLTIDPQITSVENLRNLQILLGGVAVPLSDIAVIQERAKPDQPEAYFASSNKTIRHGISFDIYKTSAVTIDTAVTNSEKTIQDALAAYPGQFTVNTVYNTGHMIDKQFNDLYRDFAATVFLVFLTLFIFLGIRQALIVLLAMPLTFSLTFTVMQITGIPLSFIAVFSLLLSLGLLVDDTIVIISAMTAYHRTGRFAPLQTGLLVWRDFIFAIFTTTITTVFAFLPLLLASGIIGTFIRAIPIVVSTSLLGSFFVAMLITLPVFINIFDWKLPRRVVIFLKILFAIILFVILFIVLPKGPLFLLELVAVGVFFFVTKSARIGMITRGKAFIQQRSDRHKTKEKSSSSRYLTNGVIHFERVAQRYRIAMHKILTTPSLRKRIIIMVIIFALFSYLLLPLGFVKNEFFPKTDSDYVYMSLELPSGTNLSTTNSQALSLLDQLRKTQGISYATAQIGQGVSDNGGSSSQGVNTVLFSLVLPPSDQRKINSIDISQKLRDTYASFAKGTVSVNEVSNGPPAGADIQIKLFGDDLTTLDQYANKVKDFLKAQKGTANIDKSIKSGTSKLVFVPDKIQLAKNNLSMDTIGLWLRFFASGMKADSIKLTNDTNEDTDITLRMNGTLPFAQALDTIVIPKQTGNSVPLTSLGKFILESNPTLITRENGKRTISVSASITKGFSVTDINKQLEDFANNKLNLQNGYSWSTGGVNEQNQQSITSILQAMLLSFLLIIVTMVIQFSSFRKALIVMLVIPLSISGVFIIFSLMQIPLSFPALIGVLALFGIVVKNSILIVDKINQNKKIGMGFIDSIVDGASSRLEAVALTSFATIVGLLPITLSDPLWRGLGGAIIAGLAFSGTIMLFFIPLVYFYWFRSDAKPSERVI